MATKQLAHWSDADVKALIEFLVAELPSAGDGISFKAAVWTEAAIAVNKVVKTKGADKTASSCKNKFTKLREVYNIVLKIKSQSGFTWDDEKGANIDETSAAVWEAYEKKNKGSAPFRNKGWAWFNEVQPLMPTMARGANAFRATQGTQDVTAPEPPEDTAPTPDDDHPLVTDWAPSSPSPQPRTRPVAVHSSRRELRDDESSDQDEPSSQADVITAKRKHSALPGSDAPSSSSVSSKRVRPSGAQALHSMNERLDDFTVAFRQAFSTTQTEDSAGAPSVPIFTTPQRRAQAISRAQDIEDTLSDKKLVKLIDLFRTDISMADTYLSLKRKGVRLEWVQKHVVMEEEEENED